MGDMECGWGNGYVNIPFGHPWYGLHYDEIQADVNGGLTFSEQLTPGYWTIGFDTCHSWDTKKLWPMAKVLEETMKLLQQVEAAANDPKQ